MYILHITSELFIEFRCYNLQRIVIYNILLLNLYKSVNKLRNISLKFAKCFVLTDLIIRNIEPILILFMFLK